MSRTLLVTRPVLNGEEIVAWARGQGFANPQRAGSLHVTLAFSRLPITDWAVIDRDPLPRTLRVEPGPARAIVRLAQSAIALRMESELLTARHLELRAVAGWDYPGYQAHITLSYDDAALDVEAVEPFGGVILLGREQVDPSPRARRLADRPRPAP